MPKRRFNLQTNNTTLQTTKMTTPQQIQTNFNHYLKRCPIYQEISSHRGIGAHIHNKHKQTKEQNSLTKYWKKKREV